MARKKNNSAGAEKTTWNFGPLFKGDDDRRIKEKTTEVEQKSYEFINAWKKRDDYLREPLSWCAGF